MPTLVMRPAGVLGDSDNGTYTTDTGPAPGGSPALTTLTVTATSPLPSTDLGTITSVELAAVVYLENAAAYTPECWLTWARDAGYAATAVASSFASGGFTAAVSDTYTTNPWTGQPWTWTDLNDIVALGAVVEYTYNPVLPGPVKLNVSEVYVTVVYTDHLETQTMVERSFIVGSAPGAGATAGPVTVTMVTRARGGEAVT
jgi:hypothetical protein